ncbi:TnsA endonuclease N-terminal domain-containing protein [Pandoraea commovens]|uniref:TnsA endonuclease N-terminal domain-containing protein n=1 Tax=Pandoraea commovens TaxID=2508289 RepID=A0ABY5QGP1_9BURK|nr:TnsA endonuclease N-terminal domain-containing protein [Pandoraea commovens]UVA79981.1 TnsA endonuclease N-terminal domain-containing protein [Pandoraea commovens]
MGDLLHNVPTRRIGVSTRGVTGAVPSFGRYESSLERDLMEIFRFDPNVERFVPQPLTIEYRDDLGGLRRYTPDGLIYFKENAGLVATPVLFEVKYRADFRKDWKILMPKFRAAKAYCLRHGWRFQIFTEREIRTPYLENVRFLWAYLEQVPSSDLVAMILQTLWDLDEADPDLLLYALCHDSSNRARMIPAVWHLVATGAIGCDLNLPLTMRSRIWAEMEC